MIRLDEVKELLDLTYRMRLEGLEQITPHLIGPPGVGKSTVVYEWAVEKARSVHKQFVDYDTLTTEDVSRILRSPQEYFVFADKRLTGMDPVDFSGIPRPLQPYAFVRFLPLDLAKLLSVCAGVLFLDELLNEQRPNMRAAAFKLVRDYKIGDLAMSREAMVIAASNSAEYSSLVETISKPLRDRFVFIPVGAPSLEAWADWMDHRYGAENWYRNTLAYLHWKPTDFLTNVEDLGTDNGWEPPATPRGWTYVSLAFKRAPKKYWPVIAAGKLGQVGERLVAFLENKVPSFKELVARPSVIANFSIEQKYLAAMTVAEAINVNKRNIRPAIAFVDFIARNDDREIISALFAFLEQKRRAELYAAVRNNPVIYEALKATGRALL